MQYIHSSNKQMQKKIVTAFSTKKQEITQCNKNWLKYVKEMNKFGYYRWPTFVCTRIFWLSCLHFFPINNKLSTVNRVHTHTHYKTHLQYFNNSVPLENIHIVEIDLALEVFQVYACLCRPYCTLEQSMCFSAYSGAYRHETNSLLSYFIKLHNWRDMFRLHFDHSLFQCILFLTFKLVISPCTKNKKQNEFLLGSFSKRSLN